jgi:hypothetical protein
MARIRQGFLDNRLTDEQVKFYAQCNGETPIFDDEQMKQIYYGFKDGLTDEKVKLYAKSEFNGKLMQNIREDFEKLSDYNISKDRTFKKIKEKYNLK